MKQQLLVINRSRRRAPNLTAIDRILLGFWSLFLSPHGIRRAAAILKPSTLLKFHDILKNRKYRLLYSSGRKGKPGPKGPSRELLEAIVELKRRNTRFGCRRIAQQINKALACTPVMLTVWPCVECSTPPFQPRVFKNISALTTIRYSCITNGKRTYGFLRSRRLRLSPTHRYHIPLLSD